MNQEQNKSFDFYKELLTGVSENKTLELLKQNNNPIVNHEKGEYVDFETRYFTLTYLFNDKQISDTIDYQYGENEMKELV